MAVTQKATSKGNCTNGKELTRLANDKARRQVCRERVGRDAGHFYILAWRQRHINRRSVWRQLEQAGRVSGRVIKGTAAS